MTEFTVNGEGTKEFSIDADGTPNISSDKPVNISPNLPVTDIRVNLLELIAIELVREGGKRTFRGQYADGGTFEVSIDAEAGKLNSSGSNVTTNIEDGADKSHTVVSYLPRVRHVKKATH